MKYHCVVNKEKIIKVLETFRHKIYTFFSSIQTFENDEWLLKHQISALLIVSFALGTGIFIFAIYRSTHGNLVAGMAQFLFSFFLLLSFIRLKHDKYFYATYSVAFFVLFFIYILIVFFFVPQNHLNILWIVSAPVLIFFFLDKRGGIMIFLLLMGFILYLLFIRYPYTIAEYVTLFATLSTSTLIMYAYEKLKDSEKQRLIEYNETLRREIEVQTKGLQELNATLEQRIKDEVEQRLDQEQILLRQNRMVNMGTMVDAIAHQWRQPLMNINAIMMNLNRSVSFRDDTAYEQQKIKEVFSLTAHMSDTIEDFRELLHNQKGKQIFDVSEALEHVFKLMRNNLRSVDLHFNNTPKIMLDGHQSEFYQVIIILLSNALETLEYRKVTDKSIVIDIKKDSKILSIGIEDNGGGIADASFEKIFDPYYTTKKRSSGTGLGLYIAKIIVEHNMRGTLKVFNTEQGACFIIKIPL